MTIKDLIKALQQAAKVVGDDTVVLLAADEEQNQLGDVLDIQQGNLEPLDNYYGDNVKQGDKIIVISPNM